LLLKVSQSSSELTGLGDINQACRRHRTNSDHWALKSCPQQFLFSRNMMRLLLNTIVVSVCLFHTFVDCQDRQQSNERRPQTNRRQRPVPSTPDVLFGGFQPMSSNGTQNRAKRPPTKGLFKLGAAENRKPREKLNPKPLNQRRPKEVIQEQPIDQVRGKPSRNQRRPSGRPRRPKNEPTNSQGPPVPPPRQRERPGPRPSVALTGRPSRRPKNLRPVATPGDFDDPPLPSGPTRRPGKPRPQGRPKHLDDPPLPSGPTRRPGKPNALRRPIDLGDPPLPLGPTRRPGKPKPLRRPIDLDDIPLPSGPTRRPGQPRPGKAKSRPSRPRPVVNPGVLLTTPAPRRPKQRPERKRKPPGGVLNKTKVFLRLDLNQEHIIKAPIVNAGVLPLAFESPSPLDLDRFPPLNKVK